MKYVEEQREGGGDRGTLAGEEHTGAAGLCMGHMRARGSGVCACETRLWKKHEARRKVQALSVGSSPKISKNLTAWRVGDVK